MRVLVTVVDPRQDLSRDVVIQADDGVTVADTIPELVRAARATPTADNVISISAGAAAASSNGVPVLYHLGERLDPTRPLSESGLREGSLISVADPTASLLDEPPGLVELRLVSGPGAGGVHRLVEPLHARGAAGVDDGLRQLDVHALEIAVQDADQVDHGVPARNQPLERALGEDVDLDDVDGGEQDEVLGALAAPRGHGHAHAARGERGDEMPADKARAADHEHVVELHDRLV